MRNIFRKRNTSLIGRSYADKIFDVCNVALMIILLVIFIFPLWYVVVASFSDPFAVARGEVWLWPVGFSLRSYELVMEFKQLWIGYANTIFYTIVGTTLNMLFSVCMAYPMSVKEFVPRKFFMVMFMITMYFGGGLIPSYLVVKQLGILDTRWAMIIPGLVNVYNCLIIRSYFMNSIPKDLNEAATLDGANSAQYLLKVVLPLSKPVLAVVGLYYMVAHWNNFYTALVYLYKQELMPLQSVLRNLLSSAQLMSSQLMETDVEMAMEMLERSMGMRFSVIIIAAVPVLCVYPFVQKFFVKGVMVGAVKG